MSCDRCQRPIDSGTYRELNGHVLCGGCVKELTACPYTTGLIIAWLRKPSEDGVDCSADRELLAQRLERKEHLK